MRVLIIATNRAVFPNAVPPLGAAIVTSALRKSGYHTELCDLCFERNPKRRVRREIRRFKPDVIGLSIRNLDSCSYHYPESYIESTQEVVNTIRTETTSPIIAGGSAMTIGGVDLLHRLGLGLGVVGGGELSAPALVAALGNGRSGLNAIPGLIALNGHGHVVNTPDRSRDLDVFPLNDISMVEMNRYLKAGGLVGIQTKRGCPFRCLYCNYSSLEGKRYRLCSPELCIDDIERIVVEKRVRDFFFADSVFNVPYGHTMAICEELARRELGVRWMAYCNPLRLDRDMARAFKASGCIGIELGLDVASAHMLQSLRKGFTQEDIATACDALDGESIPFAHFMLFGGPDETWKDIEESKRFLSSTAPAKAVFATLGVRIYRDTAMYDYAIEEELISAGETALDPLYYLSPSLGSDAVRRLDRIAAQTTTWMTPTDWESPMIKAVHYLTNRIRAFPNWKGFEEYGKRMRRFQR